MLPGDPCEDRSDIISTYQIPDCYYYHQASWSTIILITTINPLWFQSTGSCDVNSPIDFLQFPALSEGQLCPLVEMKCKTQECGHSHSLTHSQSTWPAFPVRIPSAPAVQGSVPLLTFGWPAMCEPQLQLQAPGSQGDSLSGHKASYSHLTSTYSTVYTIIAIFVFYFYFSNWRERFIGRERHREGQSNSMNEV